MRRAALPPSSAALRATLRLTAVAAATFAATSSSLPAQRASAPPTLVVQLTVDQLRPDYLDRFRSQLTGGLGRLLARGAYFANATHDHATTETAPGHATLWSGRTPAHTGIVLNDIGVPDPQSPIIVGKGGGASPYRFRGSSYFDWVRAKEQFSIALSVSRKDRGAILPLGRARQSVYWYSADGRFTTSRYYGDTLPTWVRQFNARNIVAPYRGRSWLPLLAATAYPEPDDIGVESLGKEYVFPHVLPTDSAAAASAFPDFPWMDDETVHFAIAGVRALDLGAGPRLDVLAVSLSATDAIGHRYGPDSREVHDQVLRVDRALGVLMDSLFAMRDSTRIIFALGSDHGVAPFPELHFPGTDSARGRVDPRPVVDRARSALIARGVEGDALALESGIVVLDTIRLRAAGIAIDSTIRALRAQFAALPGMWRVDRVPELAAHAARGDIIARRWRNAIPADMSAVLTLTFRPYHYWFTTRYATHGSPHDYDARIPVLLMGPGVLPGRYTGAVRSVDVAPTLAALTGVVPTERLDGRVLREALTPARPR
jgi:hypothetical protein